MAASWKIMGRWCFAAGAIATLCGCGGGSGKSQKLPTTTQSSAANAPAAGNPAPAPMPPPVAPVANPPPPIKKPAEKTKLSSAEQAVANADPKNVYEIAAEGPEFLVGSAEEVAKVDRVTIDSLANGAASTQFIAGTPTGADGRTILVGGPGASSPQKSTVKLPSGFTEAPEFGYAESGLPLRLMCDKTESLMALVLSGPTRIGSDDGPSEVRPEFRPLVETFYMDVTEVTLEQYDLYRQDMKSKKNNRVQSPSNESSDPRAPALGLPWAIAQAFAHWAGKELPTEVEFEKAARGPDGFRTPWGNGRAVFGKYRDAELISNVGSFATDQSVYGIYDLAGNAREWCSDHYSETAHQEAKGLVGLRAQEWPGPKRASTSGQRVVKGNGGDWSAWQRQGRAATERHPDVGFRCVLRIKAAETAAATPSRN